MQKHSISKNYILSALFLLCLSAVVVLFSLDRAFAVTTHYATESHSAYFQHPIGVGLTLESSPSSVAPPYLPIGVGALRLLTDAQPTTSAPVESRIHISVSSQSPHTSTNLYDASVSSPTSTQTPVPVVPTPNPSVRATSVEQSNIQQQSALTIQSVITDASWRYVISDGGRASAGYTPQLAQDCVPRAIAIATHQSYDTVYQALHRRTELFKQTPQGSSYTKICCDQGTNRFVYKQYLRDLGWRYYHEENKPQNARLSLYSPELHSGTVMIIIDNHLFTMIDGVAYDEDNITSPQSKQHLNPGLYITGYFRKI